MSDRFVNKTKEFEVDVNDNTFTVKHLNWTDRRKLSAIVRKINKPLQPYIKSIIEINNSDLDDAEKEKQIDAVKKPDETESYDYIEERDVKVVNEIIINYIVKIKDCDIPIKDIQFKEHDVLELMHALIHISTPSEEEVKNSDASPSGE